MDQPKVLIVGVSGPSCSGKTTLARLLRDIWPSTFILHEDDFYWTDAQIPVKDGLQDWDCLESIDLEAFRAALEYIHGHGALPPNLKSKEDQNSVGESGVNPQAIQSWKEKIKKAAHSNDLRIAVCDGFLLYSEHMKPIWELLDVRLFLRAEYAMVKRRREARSGYVTLEGFWEDPPDYVDRIVWPNYVNDHEFLFQAKNVEGDVDEDVTAAMNLQVMPKHFSSDMTQCLDWACHILKRVVDDQIGH